MEAFFLSEQIVCNAWMKKEYAWFSNGKDMEDRNKRVHIGGDDVFFYDDADIDSDVNSNVFDGGVWGNKTKQNYLDYSN